MGTLMSECACMCVYVCRYMEQHEAELSKLTSDKDLHWAGSYQRRSPHAMINVCCAQEYTRVHAHAHAYAHACERLHFTVGTHACACPMLLPQVLWAEQLEKAENKRKSPLLYSRNMARVLRAGRDILEAQAEDERTWEP